MNYLFSIGPLDDEFVLKHDQVPFTGTKAHELLELRAQGIEKVSLGNGGRLGRKEANPPHAGNDSFGFGLIGKLGDMANGRNQSTAT